MCRLTGWTEKTLQQDGKALGMLLENFVANELLKQSSWAMNRYGLYHFRTSAGREVDLVVEHDARRVPAIEIKAGRTVTENDFAGLEAFREAAGRRFHRGVVLYGGSERLPFGPQLHALPLSALWLVGARSG